MVNYAPQGPYTVPLPQLPRQETLMFRTAAAFVMLAALATACSPREEFRGAVLEETRLAQVQPGRTQAEVTQLLGSPSSTSTFNEAGNTWYYISRGTEAVAFMAPEVVSQRVVAVDFDPGGRVRDVRQYGLKDGEDVPVVSRETPTKGKELSIMEQFLGNIGKFNSGRGPGGR
jgi:outer membrane protein assembly factor BamE (lipoprotein component of BamABCDE complex)